MTAPRKSDQTSSLRKSGFVLAMLLATGTAQAQVSIPIPNILAEVETFIKNGQSGDAAALLDRVLTRADEGEAMPEGVDMDRIRLAAATHHFRAQNLPRTVEIINGLLAKNPSSSALVAEARMLLGLALALQEKFIEAIPVFASAEQSPAYRDKAMLYGAMSAQQAGRLDDAIAAYTRLLGTSARDRDWADAALSLINLQLRTGDLSSARRGLGLLRGSLPLVDNLAGLNVLSLQLGDELTKANDPAGALTAYRTVLFKKDIIEQQLARNARMEADIKRIQDFTTGDATQMDSVRRISARLEQAKTAIEEIRKLENYDATLLFRLGNAFQLRGGVWEAALIFEEIIQKYPQSEEREQAFLGLVRAYSESGRVEKTRLSAERFQRTYPDSKFGAQALYLAAVAAGQRNDTAAQLEFLNIATEKYRDNRELREPMLLMKANALFTTGRYPEVSTVAQEYLSDFPQGKFVEEAAYISAMAVLAEGEASAAAHAIKTYLESYPQGKFVEDARYRLAATEYAKQNYQVALDATQSWLADYPTEHPQRGEVLSLQGDAQSGLNQTDAAIASYQQALLLPLSDEQLGYVLDELTRLYQSQRDYDSAVAMWEQFATDRPDHPFVVNAAYWIGRLRSREGRTEEALSRVADITSRYVSDAERDSVERLLIEVASMLAKPPRAKRGEPRPEPPSIDQLFTRVDQLLLTPGNRNSETAKARALFVKSEIAGLRKQLRLQSEYLDRIASTSAADTLPPGILGKLGDHLLAKGEIDLARTFYTQIVSAHPKSIFADYGYTGLGEIALREGDGQEALRLFNNAIDLAGARFKLLEATLGQAQALLQLGRLNAAQDLFEQVAGNRAWRGPATAESLYSLGEILMKRGTPDDIAKAQAHYQRIYISYRRFVPWVAKAYLRSAEAFESLGQNQEAANALREMLRDERLTDLPETATARTKLISLEAGLPATVNEGGNS